ncbi:MAG: hypothetical protein PHH11_00465 [Methylomonas sp.]|nr:hypothetical protein [Methylomonas sp.]
MNILVIDNADQLVALLTESNVDVVYGVDEIQALNVVERQRPDLILLDYAVLGEQTPEYIRLLLEANEGAKLVVVGENLDEDDIFLCLLMGAAGYQDKCQLPAYLDKLLQVVAKGEVWVSRKMVARVLDALRQLNADVLTA